MLAHLYLPTGSLQSPSETSELIQLKMQKKERERFSGNIYHFITSTEGGGALTFLLLKQFEAVDDKSEINSQSLSFESATEHDGLTAVDDYRTQNTSTKDTMLDVQPLTVSQVLHVSAFYGGGGGDDMVTAYQFLKL